VFSFGDNGSWLAMKIVSRIAGRLRHEASQFLTGAGQRFSGKNRGDGWSGMTALGARTVLDIGACGGKETLAKAAGVVLEVLLAPLYKGQPSFAELHSLLGELGFRFVGTRDQFFGSDGKVIYLDACFLR
jgi:hypothetical protein